MCTNSPLPFEAYLQPSKQKTVQAALQGITVEIFPLELLIFPLNVNKRSLLLIPES